MARPRSIYERRTTSTLPPPELREKLHRVVDQETLIGIANVEYLLQEYDPDRWREMAFLNGIDNPFSFVDEFIGQTIRVPAKPLPEFT
jgi:hypothetical protein